MCNEFFSLFFCSFKKYKKIQNKKFFQIKYLNNVENNEQFQNKKQCVN